MTRTIAITGATGFIGFNITKQLINAGYQIKALARPVSNRTCLKGYPIQWIEGNLSDQNSLRLLVKGSDVVVHCAGLVRGVSEKQFDHVNVDGVARLVQSAREQHRSPRFLLISSLAAKEPGLSPYTASKRKGEEVLAAEAGGLLWSIFRPCAVYGPGDREIRPLLLWMKHGIAPVLGSEETRFSLLYVNDLAEAAVLWLKRGYKRATVFELHDGQPNGYNLKDVIKVFAGLRDQRVFKLKVPARILNVLAQMNVLTAETFGYNPMLTPGKVRELLHPSWVGDNTEISRDIGWAPRVLLKKGIPLTLEWGGFH